MPRALVTTDGRTYALVDQPLAPLRGDEVRVQVEFAAPKHGTEQHSLDGSVFDRKRWDPDLRMFLPRTEPMAQERMERNAGNMVVGSVIEAGPEARDVRVGDRVFGYGPIRDMHQAPAEAWMPVGDLTPEDCVCVDPAHVAFVAIRDGNTRIGDHIAVYGLGAIGLMAVQIARVGGARRIFGVDPSPLRRQCALGLGADAAFDPAVSDAALEIKRSTGGSGVDIAIETSGNGSALHDAIRCIRQCGIVVHVPWGPTDCSALHLDEEFHLNRPTIIGSQAWEGWGCADRSYPLWDYRRAFGATVELFRAGLITGHGIIHPIIRFEDSPAVIADLLRRPDRSIKVGVRFA